MRITLRLILSLILSVALVVLGFALYQAYEERDRLERELDVRSALRAGEFAEEAAPVLRAPTGPALAALIERFSRRERAAGIAIYGPTGDLLAATRGFADLPSAQTFAADALRSAAALNGDVEAAGRKFRVRLHPIGGGTPPAGAVAIVHDTSYIDRNVAAVWKRNFTRLLIQAMLISVVTLLVMRWTVLGPLDRLARWIKTLRTGGAAAAAGPPPSDLFPPLAREITHLAHSFRSARAAAEEEARLREKAESVWTADRLKEYCRTRLGGRPLVAVSNREPYMHVREGRQVRCLVPASGLVTALEPILRACGGAWVAHGAGSADRETVDAADRVRVPPEDPQYTLRRVWLTPEDEQGHYYGFSNEGLWPLCHIAHARPLFRPADWERYRAVNARFRDAVVEEIADAVEPLLLLQDYHFALLPRLIKQRRPDARVAIFWHIPWPNPEAFGICPWQRDILDGMLGADLIGFHTQFHCNNFLETVDRALESRIDWERFAVNRQAHVTSVKPFPISVAFTGAPAAAPAPDPAADRAAVVRAIGFDAPLLAVGVDRLDYTKGILERFRAVERFLDKYPDYRGRFTCVELGAPSRTQIPRYDALVHEIEAEAGRINARFRDGPWRPIALLVRHHSHAEIEPFYRAAALCLVTSLHDGMNLVAKEFIASRADEDGVLVLSQFAGASRELRDALIVNPYDVDQSAEAIRYALEMEPPERRGRMRRLRAAVRDRNVYRWAAELIGELSQVRLESADAVGSGTSAG